MVPFEMNRFRNLPIARYGPPERAIYASCTIAPVRVFGVFLARDHNGSQTAGKKDGPKAAIKKSPVPKKGLGTLGVPTCRKSNSKTASQQKSSDNKHAIAVREATAQTNIGTSPNQHTR